MVPRPPVSVDVDGRPHLLRAFLPLHWVSDHVYFVQGFVLLACFTSVKLCSEAYRSPRSELLSDTRAPSVCSTMSLVDLLMSLLLVVTQHERCRP